MHYSLTGARVRSSSKPIHCCECPYSCPISITRCFHASRSVVTSLASLPILTKTLLLQTTEAESDRQMAFIAGGHSRTISRLREEVISKNVASKRQEAKFKHTRKKSPTHDIQILREVLPSFRWSNDVHSTNNRLNVHTHFIRPLVVFTYHTLYTTNEPFAITYRRWSSRRTTHEGAHYYADIARKCY